MGTFFTFTLFNFPLLLLKKSILLIEYYFKEIVNVLHGYQLVQGKSLKLLPAWARPTALSGIRVYKSQGQNFIWRQSILDGNYNTFDHSANPIPVVNYYKSYT